MTNETSTQREMLDQFTKDLFARLEGGDTTLDPTQAEAMLPLVKKAERSELTRPIVELFQTLLAVRTDKGLSPEALGVDRERLLALALKHRSIDEHGVTIGGRVGRALSIVAQANARVRDYLERKDSEAPSGIELWDRILENQARIAKTLNLGKDDWNRFGAQIANAINDVETLARCIDLPADAIRDVTRVTASYRMRLTPYYASLIMPERPDDPVLLQSVPTAEMVDTTGVEIPPVASDHSPARLVDQFYPRVVTIKATNICAMYCVHCLRIAHIGKKDRNFGWDAYEEALEYIRENTEIRDVLITGGDAFMLPNTMLQKLLRALDEIDHVRMKRLGTRVPVTTPQRVDQELLDILAESNDKGPVRVVTQINTAQEITPVSKDAFKRISGSVSAVLNQAVLLRGINDSTHKMWKLCETIQEAYVRPYYVFNCSYRNPQYFHLRVPVEKGRDIVEGMYGNISGDAIPRYIAAAGGKIPLHRDNLVRREHGDLILRKPWSGEETRYPDADPEGYADDNSFAFNKYGEE
jgi:KamA family protein